MTPEFSQSLVSLFQRLTGRSVHQVTIQFFPYARLVHTIRYQNSEIRIRISDILEPAPPRVIESISRMLTYRLAGRRAPRTVAGPYLEYTTLPDTVAREKETRRQRGKKRILEPSGTVHDLTAIFNRLSAEYFEGRLSVSALGWSVRRSRRTLGHYDSAHDTIVINPRLDSPTVPEYVVGFVLYHEMLHAHFGEEHRNGIRLVHHQRLRAAERRFEHYRRAKEFIREYFERSQASRSQL